jgi:hypothetical protein
MSDTPAATIIDTSGVTPGRARDMARPLTRDWRHGD